MNHYLKSLCIYLMLCTLAINSFANEKDTIYSKAVLQKIVSRNFSEIVTGKSNTNDISNNASIDPTKGSITLQGTLPIIFSKDSARISFLTFKVDGDLINEEYSELFTNSKINTNTTFDIQYHIRFRKEFKVNYLKGDEIAFGLKQTIVEKKRKNELAKLNYDATCWDDERTLASINLKLKMAELDKIHQNSRSAKQKLEQTNELKDKRKIVDSLYAFNDTIQKLVGDTTDLSFKIDSLTFLINNSFFVKNGLENIINEKYEIENNELTRYAPSTGIQYGWFSILIGASNNKFYSYLPSESFYNQIQSNDIKTFRFGLAYNFIKESSFPNKVFYGNLGFTSYLNNNIDELSTKKLKQDITSTNVLGDTVRTLTKTYSVYTDSIKQFNYTKLYANLYFIHSSRKYAFHIFPSIEFNLDESNSMMNLGFGYLMSFKNEKKENKSIINAEAYILFEDLQGRVKNDLKLLNRNTIGLRLTIPFHFLKQ